MTTITAITTVTTILTSNLTSNRASLMSTSTTVITTSYKCLSNTQSVPGSMQEYKELGAIVCVLRESVGDSLGETGYIHEKRIASPGSLCLPPLCGVGKAQEDGAPNLGLKESVRSE